jgi:hypothetical protein
MTDGDGHLRPTGKLMPGHVEPRSLLGDGLRGLIRASRTATTCTLPLASQNRFSVLQPEHRGTTNATISQSLQII